MVKGSTFELFKNHGQLPTYVMWTFSVFVQFGKFMCIYLLYVFRILDNIFTIDNILKFYVTLTQTLKHAALTSALMSYFKRHLKTCYYDTKWNFSLKSLKCKF